MKKLYTLLTALLTLYFAQAQELVPMLAQTAGGSGNDYGSGVAVDHKGGVYAIGSFRSPSFTIGSSTLTNNGNSDAFLAKYDTSGALIWVQPIGSTGADSAARVLVSPDGFIFVVAGIGASTTIGSTAVSAGSYLLKFNPSGGLEWARTDIRTEQLAIDPQGNFYSLGGGTSPSTTVSFSKYSPAGTLLFIREVTVFLNNNVMTPLLSVDWQGQVHLLIHTPSGTRITTIPANNLNITVSFASRLLYDPSGNLLSGESLSGIIRERLPYYKAKGTNQFVYTHLHPSLTLSTTYGWSSRGFGSIRGFAQCYFAPSSQSADFDGSDAAYFGETYTTPPTDCMANPVLPQSEGTDMVFIRSTALGSFVYSTNANGRTNERNVTVAVDTTGRYMFAVGSWSKAADTSHFRFGSSDLVNAGATGTSDFLFLKFKTGAVPLKAKAGPDKTICLGGSATINGAGDGGTGAYTYNWTPATGLSDATVATPVANPTATTSYILTVTDGAGAISRDTMKVVVDTALYRPTILLMGGDNPFCEGRFVELLAGSGSNFTWSNGATGAVLRLTASDSVTVTGVSSQGCTGTSLPFIAVMKPTPVKPTITPAGPLALCQDSSVVLTASHPDPAVTFSWSPMQTSTASVTVNAAGNYLVSARLDGCLSNSASVSVTVAPPPTATISATGNTTFCEGDSVKLSVSTASGNTILWSNGAATQSIWVKTGGTYSAQVTSPAGCTITTNSINVTVKPKPATPTISASGSTTFCSGGSVTLTASTSTSGVSWQWSNGATTPSITVNASGTYTATASINGCSSTSANTTVTVNPAPTGSISASGSTSLCEGDSVQLTVSTAQGNSILWSNGATTQSIWVKTGGTYSVQLTSAQGCTATTNSISTSVLQRPSPVIGQNGNELTVSPAAASYQWYLNGSAISGATSQTITISQGGDYSVVVTGSNGCTATAYHSAVFRVNTSFIAYQAYPNPVTADLRLAYTLKEGGQVTFTIMDDQGRQKMVIPVGNQAPGDHQYTIRNAAMRLGTGFYLLKITVGDKQVIHRIVVL
jgi:hypothetical protein